MNVREKLSSSEYEKIRRRVAKVYDRWGADAARRLLTIITAQVLGDEAAQAVRRLKRRELRALLAVPTDKVGYLIAVDAHRTAWEVAGWHARPWWDEGGSGGKRRNRGGRKNSLNDVIAIDAKRGGSK